MIRVPAVVSLPAPPAMRVIVLVGLPGSGKSTWLNRLGVVALSSDSIRKLLADDETVQSIHDTVFQTLRYLLRQRLMLGRPVTFVDATNLTPRERAPYIAIAQSYGCRVEAVFFDVSLQVCRRRNAGRRRVVPAEALESMAFKLIPPSLEEGFDRITIAPADGPPVPFPAD